MKRIYAFTLDGEDCVSRKFRSDLRLLAYLMYDSVYNYFDEDSEALITGDNIVYNNIIEGNKCFGWDSSYKSYTNYEYYLESDIYDNGCIDYEPFLIGDRTFAFTVDDQIISEDILDKLFCDNLNVTNLNYNYKIRTVGYELSSKHDNKSRKKARDLLFVNLGCEPVKKKIFSRNKKNTKVLVRKFV